MEDISNEQTELLLQFQDLSGIEDLERCKVLLENHHWNIESAVRDTFEEEIPSLVIPPPPPLIEERMPIVNLHPQDQRIFRFVRRPEGMLGWGYFIISYPIQFWWTKLFNLFRYLYQLLRNNPRAISSTPLQDVTDFISAFENDFGKQHVNFARLTYAQALNEAKRDFKFLLVYLHSPHHQDTIQFCRDVLCSQHLKNFLDDRFIIWGCSVNNPEGYKVSRALRETTYPFLSLIVLKMNIMTSVARLEGLIDVHFLTNRLDDLINEHQTSLVSARLDRDARSFNVTLRQQQDEAYQQSLLIDRERERRQSEMEAVDREKDRMIVKKQKEEEDRIRRQSEVIENEREEARERLICEPSSDSLDCIRIMLKLPSGTRLERRFLKSDPITLLHDFVFVHEAAPDNFEIVRNMPRQVITCHPFDQPIVPQSLPSKPIDATPTPLDSLPSFTKPSEASLSLRERDEKALNSSVEKNGTRDDFNFTGSGNKDGSAVMGKREDDASDVSQVNGERVKYNGFEVHGRMNGTQSKGERADLDDEYDDDCVANVDAEHGDDDDCDANVDAEHDDDDVDSRCDVSVDGGRTGFGSKGVKNTSTFADFGFGKSELLYVHDADA